MPQYVVLYHQMPDHASRAHHWDLMLEDAGILLTWELPLPPDQLSEPTGCQQLPDHRMHYLDYEGPLSENRGHVSRWDEGSFEFLTKSSASLSGRMDGRILSGTFQIELRQANCLFSWLADPQ